MVAPDKDIRDEIEEQRPQYPVGLLSRREKDHLIERGLVGLYRWYIDRSQATRSWSADRSFDWRAFRSDHSPEMNTLMEGFYAIEQYVPDYTVKTINEVRKSYGRSQFQIRWGSEEQKHSDVWLNTLLFSRHRTPKWIEDYKESLRNREWMVPWEDAIHMSCYVVIQERATQVNYVNAALAAKGQNSDPVFAEDTDPILAQVAEKLVIDEAAHYGFFLEVLRMYLYYYPAETIEALFDTINHFAMPALDLTPYGAEFSEALYRYGIYGPREYSRDVLRFAMNSLGIKDRRALERGIRRSRQVPDEDGNFRETAFFDTLDYDKVETKVKKMFGRIERYEQEIGFDEIYPTQFASSGMKGYINN